MIVVGLLFVGLAGSFYVGRAYERRVAPPPRPLVAGGFSLDEPGAPAVRGETEVDEGDVFDRTDDPGTLEPERQATSPTQAAEAAAKPRRRPTRPAADTVAADGGGFYVQVFAGRDQAAAAGLVDRLEGGGHTVKLITEREGAGALYKVRVGGYSTRELAGQAAKGLQAQGYSGAWVTRED